MGVTPAGFFTLVTIKRRAEGRTETGRGTGSGQRYEEERAQRFPEFGVDTEQFCIIYVCG